MEGITMKCPGCQFDNREGARFCGKCGNKFEITCQECGAKNRTENNFCDECGFHLEPALETPVETIDADRLPSPPSAEKPSSDDAPIEGERKHVTVLFSDLTGYTAMSEKLDPEEVKEITSQIFGEISKIVDKYDGFIEKYAGDAVLALFGAQKTHEDDPIRAVKAAIEIHELVEALGPEIENRIGQPISMHSAVNTGLVVTGEVDMEKGTHGVAGDTINLASRLSSLAKAGEILAGPDTYRQSEGYFDFAELESAKVKGKTEPVRVYKVLSAKEKPLTIRRLSGLRAELIGRKVEMAQLREAFEKLQEGKGSIFSICGDAGTGKSRLVEEFRATLDPVKFQWLEGHAYAYSQNIPYFPLIDFLNRVLQIEEGDPPEKVRERVESGIENLIGKKEDIVPYVGSLYSLSYLQVADVSPEFWKSRLQNAIQTILSAVAQKAPTIFFLEDLHWADSAFLELLRKSLLEIRHPAIVLCVYRPVISLFTSHLPGTISKTHHEIRLQDLSSSEAQDMVESLLKTESIPSELKQFVQEKLEGNPFYLEEVINSLIESETLIRDNGSWKLTRQIIELDISSTIHGVISARLDRLENETKRVLQEASVIGRAFLYDILRRITELKDQCDRCLSGLERLDLIRTRSLHPELEYVFKHALTQEVVYNGLLKKKRKEIHERIGLVMEQLFRDRLSEFYEALAFHFLHGSSVIKAVEYLVKSGEKSHKRYALEEAHQYFKEAYELLSSKDERTKEEDRRIIDLLIKWGYVHNCRADFKGLEELLLANEELAKSTDDREKLGMFYAWLGHAFRSREKLREGYAYLIKALQLGEEIASQKVIGYTCAWLSWTCADRGLLDEAVTYGKRAQELIEPLQSDGEFVRFTLAGLGLTHYFRGDCAEAHEIGEQLLRYGQHRSDLRCIAMGYTCIGFSHYVAGNHGLSIQSFQNAIQVSADIIFISAARLMLGVTYVASEQFSEAKGTFEEIMRRSEDYGFEFVGTAAQLFYGVIQISQGSLNKGLRIVEHAATVFLESDSMYRYAMANHTIGKVYARLALGESEKSLSLIAKNIGFLVKNILLAGKKAEAYYGKTIEVVKKIGAKGIEGQAYLDLGRLHKAKGRNEQARDCFSRAIRILEECEAEVYLKQANEALESLQ
jgi:class 3 adenylate cyclase